ncbi:putative hydrolase YxeP [Maioricimonas rarisocia]|uniref:Putative hydrolase YxeP n=1 Tax=Maioricimonas rarisocia TaxID=2528026 RepID=A0A517ZE53_9PLAN|nr:M20 family metallopeptidase [Maioricimonas rarisocia]QDU40744.1 putative hydrolase YxeP [Maioricimonas rarisocia]
MSRVDAILFDSLVDFRREMHQHPELSWEEHETAERISEFLSRHGVPHETGIAGTGVVADLPGPEGCPRVALRADIDALPIQEETELPFASKVPGVMHACGHDGHTSILLGAAVLLKQESLPAPVRLIFQPAEETGRGARAMIGAGVLDDVGMIFGGHVDRHYTAGQIAVADGAVNASSDAFAVQISGRGGHAARPHEAVDAIVVGSLLVMSLQTIVSREVNPAHPSVVTVGRFVAGSAPNVIADQAILQGTIRAQESSVRLHLQNSIQRIARAVGQLHDAELMVEIKPGTPPVINSAEMAALAREAAGEVVGEDGVVDMAHANMGGEDFGFYAEHVPACYVRFGAMVAGKEGFPAHSSRFDFDERTMRFGAEYYRAVALRAGQRLREKAGV